MTLDTAALGDSAAVFTGLAGRCRVDSIYILGHRKREYLVFCEAATPVLEAMT